MGSQDKKMAFDEKPLILNDRLDSVIARQFIQDDIVTTKLLTMSRWSLDQSSKTKILFCKLMKINVIEGLETVKYTQHKIHKAENRDGTTVFKGSLSFWLNFFRDNNFNLLNTGEFDN